MSASTGADGLDGDRSVGARLEAMREPLRAAAAYIGFGLFITVMLLVFAYLTFPYDRIADRVVAEFERAQKATPGGAKQTLSIGSIKPSWFTGIIATDIVLTTVPSDSTKPPSTLHIDELKARISLGSLFSPVKDVTFQIKAMGGTIEGSITHSKSTDTEPPKRVVSVDPKKANEPHFDRMIKAEIDGLDIAQITPFRDAVGVPVGGTLKGSVDLTLVGGRLDRSNGTLSFDLDNFWVSDGKVPFKVPALKMAFGSDEITLPQINIGAVPVQITVKNGVAHVDKMAATGKDLDLQVDGQITLRENFAESELGLGLRFKFNESYRKKGDTTSGLLLLLDSEPKLKAGKRADGFYGLRITGLAGGSPMILPAPSNGPSLIAPAALPH